MNSWVTTGRLIWIGVFGLLGIGTAAAGVREAVGAAAKGSTEKARYRAEEAYHRAEEARYRAEEAATKAACDDCINFASREEVRAVG